MTAERLGGQRRLHIGGCPSCRFICVHGRHTARRLRAASECITGGDSGLLHRDEIARRHLPARLIHEHQPGLVRPPRHYRVAGAAHVSK